MILIFLMTNEVEHLFCMLTGYLNIIFCEVLFKYLAHFYHWVLSFIFFSLVCSNFFFNILDVDTGIPNIFFLVCGLPFHSSNGLLMNRGS